MPIILMETATHGVKWGTLQNEPHDVWPQIMPISLYILKWLLAELQSGHGDRGKLKKWEHQNAGGLNRRKAGVFCADDQLYLQLCAVDSFDSGQNHTATFLWTCWLLMCRSAIKQNKQIIWKNSSSPTIL